MWLRGENAFGPYTEMNTLAQGNKLLYSSIMPNGTKHSTTREVYMHHCNLNLLGYRPII